jgi:hypothetical protein
MLEKYDFDKENESSHVKTQILYDSSDRLLSITNVVRDHLARNSTRTLYVCTARSIIEERILAKTMLIINENATRTLIRNIFVEGKDKPLIINEYEQSNKEKFRVEPFENAQPNDFVWHDYENNPLYEGYSFHQSNNLSQVKLAIRINTNRHLALYLEESVFLNTKFELSKSVQTEDTVAIETVEFGTENNLNTLNNLHIELKLVEPLDGQIKTGSRVVIKCISSGKHFL